MKNVPAKWKAISACDACQQAGRVPYIAVNLTDDDAKHMYEDFTFDNDDYVATNSPSNNQGCIDDSSADSINLAFGVTGTKYTVVTVATTTA